MGMVSNIATTTQNMFRIPELRGRILFTLGMLLIYRVGFFVPVPGINPAEVQQMFSGGDGSDPLSGILGTFSMLSGGSLLSCTLFALGIMPYISAEIIFQLLTKVIPRLEEMQKEGESGRRKIKQYSRYTTIVICLIQAFFVIQLLQQYPDQIPSAQTLGFSGTILAMITMTAGTFFLMWLGEMITEHGIGNGVSLIIMAGILAALPQAMGLMIGLAIEDNSQVIPVVLLGLAFIAIVGVVVLITLGQRRIPIQNQKYARGQRVYGGRSDLALKVDQPGVIPIIFASALLTFPQMLIEGLFANVDPNSTWGSFNRMFELTFGNFGFLYILLYVVMTFFFCFFWTKLMFNPVELAKNMKEYGSFIPGVRPGKQTIKHIDYVVNRITLAGATFLSIIAVVPFLITYAFNVPMLVTSFLGGTGLLICVGVALDLIHKIEGHLKMRHYDGFLGQGAGASRARGRR